MKNLSYLIISVLLVFSLYSCNTKETKKEIVCEKETVIVNKGTSDYLINATLWVQQSPEFKACCFQSFNIAKTALDNNIKTAKKDKPLAVVLDIDETVLDNSYFEANLIQNDTSFTKENWKEWSDKNIATAIPGAIEFLEYAISKNVEIVYITNRRSEEVDGTIKNMKNLGFPEVKLENFYFRTDESSKVARRELVNAKFNIILLIGDNLADFDAVLDDRTVNNGFDNVEKAKDLFGQQFIVIPNPMYGNWEKPLQVDEKKTANENRIEALIGYSEISK
jgi:5'-nucleotidase (lipoprotein e(P4) family)